MNGSSTQQAIISTTGVALRVFSKVELNLNPNSAIINQSQGGQILMFHVDGDFNIKSEFARAAFFSNLSDGNIYLTVLRDMNILGSIQNDGIGNFEIYVARDLTIGGSANIIPFSLGTTIGNI